jgi:hypothetical protein
VKKRKIISNSDCLEFKNPVAKYAYRFNKAQCFGDKNKYSRKNKHNKQEVFPNTMVA